MRHHPIAELAAGVAAVAAAVVFPAVPVMADHGGSSNNPNRDNNDQEFDSHDLETKSQLACSHGKDRLGNQTEISVSVGTGDVHCFDYYMASDDGGITTCDATSWSGSRCDSYHVTFNTKFDYLDNGFWKHLGCHELGHTSSIGHRWPVTDGGDYSCMRTGSGAAQAGYPANYDGHDVEEINGDA